MTGIHVGDLVALDGTSLSGTVREVTDTGAAAVELSDGERLYCQVAHLTRLDGERLMADTVAAETTELPRAEVPSLFEPRTSPAPADDLDSIMLLLHCVIGLDFTRGPAVQWTLPERLEHVERVRVQAASELLALVRTRLQARGVHGGG